MKGHALFRTAYFRGFRLLKIENGYLAFVAGMVVGMVVFWRALGDKGLE
jgi:hypothetical protein